MKTVLIGAGSRSFGPGRITDLLRARARAEDLHGRGLTLVLVGGLPACRQAPAKATGRESLAARSPALSLKVCRLKETRRRRPDASECP